MYLSSRTKQVRTLYVIHLDKNNRVPLRRIYNITVQIPYHPKRIKINKKVNIFTHIKMCTPLNVDINVYKYSQFMNIFIHILDGVSINCGY